MSRSESISELDVYCMTNNRSIIVRAGLYRGVKRDKYPPFTHMYCTPYGFVFEQDKVTLKK